MSRAKQPRRHSRAELLILVKQQLERAGAQAISTDELLTALAPTGISRRTLERILSDLRTKHDANLVTSGKRRRWRLESPLPLPLDAPDPKDLIALHYAIAIAKPLLPLDLGDRLTTLAERLDERVRNYAGDPTRDAWLEPGELLERTIRYNSGREITRLLVTVLDGIVSIEPPELCDEVVSFCARAQTLRE